MAIHHLINYFEPNHYDINLQIDKQTRSFKGNVIIEGKAKNNNEIRLHAKNLNINYVKSCNKLLSYRQESDELIITIKNELIAENFDIGFEGHMSETAMTGLYICKYQLDGQNKEIFATQFESHHARQVFPCIDEPIAKATFSLKITSIDPNDHIILSNTPGQKNGSTWSFEKTPKMSTYLLAFVGGNLQKLSTKTNSGIEVSAYTTPAQDPSLLKYPLHTAVKALEFYENYFQTSYPLKKLDNVALPDFSAGAMENWGLVTYRESCFLANQKSSRSTKELVATVICHELAHQWFGNLVTMKWWNNLWLNESFASLMENIATDAIFPEYKVWDNFEITEVPAAINRDSLPGVQSVQQDVNSPEEISTLFDGAIVYAKGERLLKMLHEVIGEKSFRQGLANYFSKYSYQNTDENDLWHELTISSRQNIKQLMTPWISTPNLPLVSAKLSGEKITIEQSVFTLSNIDNNNRLWPIPLFSNLPSLPSIMDQQDITASLPANDFLHLNEKNISHYITEYDDNLTALLLDHIQELNPAEKTKLLRDAMDLSLSGRRDIKPIISLIKAMSGENNHQILRSLLGMIKMLSKITNPSTVEYTKLRNLAGSIFNDKFDNIFKKEPSLWTVKDLDIVDCILSGALFAKYKPALDYVQNTYVNNQLKDINSNISQFVISHNVRNNDKEFNKLWKLYPNISNPELKSDLQYSLISTKNRDFGKLILESIIIGKIKPQDILTFIYGLLANRDQRSLAWGWIQSNWPFIKKIFADDMEYEGFISAAATYLLEKTELQEYIKFTSKITDPALDRAIKMGEEQIRMRIKWIEKNQSVLKNSLG